MGRRWKLNAFTGFQTGERPQVVAPQRAMSQTDRWNAAEDATSRGCSQTGRWDVVASMHPGSATVSLIVNPPVRQMVFRKPLDRHRQRRRRSDDVGKAQWGLSPASNRPQPLRSRASASFEEATGVDVRLDLQSAPDGATDEQPPRAANAIGAVIVDRVAATKKAASRQAQRWVGSRRHPPTSRPHLRGRHIQCWSRRSPHWSELLRRGLSDVDLAKFAGANVLRAMSEAERFAASMAYDLPITTAPPAEPRSKPMG